jgi:hypothetical protein
MSEHLVSRLQAKLGECIGMMRHAAVLMENDYPDTAEDLRRSADEAEVIRWEREE